jgi:hypothetical protein
VFPTVETLVAQLIAAVLVIGSYYAARHFGGALPQSAEPAQEARAEADAAIVESLGSSVKTGSPRKESGRLAEVPPVFRGNAADTAARV